MFPLKLIVFFFVLVTHVLLITIGILANPKMQDDVRTEEKFFLTFFSESQKSKPLEPRQLVKKILKQNPPEIKKKIKPAKKKKIIEKDRLPKIEEQERVEVEIQDDVSPTNTFENKNEYKPIFAEKKDNFPTKTVKTRAKIGDDLTTCTPNYPRTSKRRGEQGTVILRFLINEEGKAEKTEIKKSSGFKRLDNAAKAGLSSCFFIPASENGVFVKDWAVIPYVFQLK